MGDESVREWLDIADSDMRSASALLDLDPPEVRTAAFHCQQAAEKYLKGFLVDRGEDPPRIQRLNHDIRSPRPSPASRMCGGQSRLQSGFGMLYFRVSLIWNWILRKPERIPRSVFPPGHSTGFAA